MGFIEWMNKRTKKMDVWDIGLTKWAVFFFALMFVKFWPALTALDWYWYAFVFVLAALRPFLKFFGK